MEDTGPKSQCVNCALLVDSVDAADNMEKMALQLTTFLIPGLFFLGIALRCCTEFQSSDHTNINTRKKSDLSQFMANKLREKEIK